MRCNGPNAETWLLTHLPDGPVTLQVVRERCSGPFAQKTLAVALVMLRARRLVRRPRHGVYELTDAGRVERNRLAGAA